MQLIGPIVRLQVQTTSLKVGEAPRRRYDPAGIRAVPVLELRPEGVVGILTNGAPIPDVHHRDHPASKFRGDNGVSIAFTADYAAMRARFRVDLADGIAGENILVQSDVRFAAAEVAGGLAVETAAGALVRLTGVIVAAPCVEFARFALAFPDDARPDRRVTEAVQFLDDGARGFYARAAVAGARVALGDRVYLDLAPGNDARTA